MNYIEDIFNKGGEPKNLDRDDWQQSATDVGPDLIKEEIMEAISNLKTCKAEGIDGIPAEMPKNLRRTNNEGAYQDVRELTS